MKRLAAKRKAKALVASYARSLSLSSEGHLRTELDRIADRLDPQPKQEDPNQRKLFK